MKKDQGGFTIIEIMIVVVIIGVLATVAVRAANEYSARAKLAEAILALTNCRTLIAEVYLSADALPTAGNWGCEVASGHSKYVDTIDTTDEGIIKVGIRGTGDLRLDFHTITMAPLDATNALMSGPGVRVSRWRCGASVDGTDISVDRLPSTCRGL
jgi:type IV pilus assembly protein PilA